MPHAEMTPEEANRYGDRLTLWEKIVLLQSWSPLLSYGQQFLSTTDPYAKSVVVSDCCEWLASRTDSGLDDELVKHMAAVLKTKEGENLVRWVMEKAQGLRA